MDTFKTLFLSLALLLLVCGHSFAQKIDPYKGKYKAGSFIDMKGNAHQGYVYYGFDDNPWIRFKRERDEKSMKFKAWKIKGFTIEADSFCVLENFQIDLEGNPSTQRMDFVQVIETGRITLFKHFVPEPSREHFKWVMGPTPHTNTMVYNAPAKDKHESFIIQEKDSPVYVPVREKDKKFRKQMSHYFAMHEELAAKIVNGVYGFDDMPAIVAEFNQWYAQQKKSAEE